MKSTHLGYTGLSRSNHHPPFFLPHVVRQIKVSATFPPKEDS
jgi:hypothetical protein